MKTERARAGWNFWLLWALANVVGWSTGATLQSAMFYSHSGLLQLIDTLPWGFLLGVSQWMILRRVLARAGWWAPATFAAWSLTGVVGNIVNDSFGESAGALFHTLGNGVANGYLQWLVLRRETGRAGWWVLASGAFLFVGLLAGAASTGFGGEGGLVATQFGIVGGTVFGATSGAVLVGLLNRPVWKRGGGAPLGPPERD